MSRGPAPFKPGDRFQNYELRRLIGEGGQGFVYEAYDEHLDHLLALKVVPTTDRTDDLKQRARMEARVLFRLRHRNIVEFHNASATDDGIVWIAMELLQGRSLHAVLRELKQLQIDEALLLGTQIAEGLGAAHAMNAIHRDLKPDNLFVEPGNVVKILDFGIAKITGLGAITTQQHVIQGTLQYMSPEHLRGDPVTGQSDIFALGCVLYELIAGRTPALLGVANPTPTQDFVAWRQMSQVPPRLDKVSDRVPNSVAQTIQHMIAKEPARRQSTMDEVARELKALQARYAGKLTDQPRELWRSSLPSRQPPVLAPSTEGNTTEPDATCGIFEESHRQSPPIPEAVETKPLPLLARSDPPAANDQPQNVLRTTRDPVNANEIRVQQAPKAIEHAASTDAVAEARKIGTQSHNAAIPVTITARRKPIIPRTRTISLVSAAILGVMIGVGILIGSSNKPKYAHAPASSVITQSSQGDTPRTIPLSLANNEHGPTMPSAAAAVTLNAPSAGASTNSTQKAAVVSHRDSPSAPPLAKPTLLLPSEKNATDSSAPKPATRKGKGQKPEPPFKSDEIVF